MQFLRKIQQQIEEIYGAKTGLDVADFVRPYDGKTRKGELIIEQDAGSADINLAVLLDRDILAAWSDTREPQRAESYSVPFEEVSHFVYLAYNHNRGRSVTHLEMEIQAEVDRVMVAFHGSTKIAGRFAEEILRDLMELPYSQDNYEAARTTSSSFIKNLAGGDPRAWTKGDFQKLCDFFHTDLSGKIHLARESKPKKPAF